MAAWRNRKIDLHPTHTVYLFINLNFDRLAIIPLLIGVALSRTELQERATPIYNVIAAVPRM